MYVFLTEIHNVHSRLNAPEVRLDDVENICMVITDGNHAPEKSLGCTKKYLYLILNICDAHYAIMTSF